MTNADEQPGKRRMCWRRLLRWMLAAGLMFLLVLAGALWWLWSHRVEYLNSALAQTGAYDGKVDGFSLSKEGASLLGFELRDAKTNDVLLRLPQIVIKSGVRDLMSRQVKLVTV